MEDGSLGHNDLVAARVDGDRLHYPKVVVVDADGMALDEPVFFAFSGMANGTKGANYAVLVDLSDTVNFPHGATGRVNLWSSFVFVDKEADTIGAVQIGVITRIDGASADLSFVSGFSFSATSDRTFSRDRVLAAPIRLGVVGGKLVSAATLFRATNVAAVNTGVALPSPVGLVTPAVGDLIAKFDYTSGGQYAAAVSGQYCGDARVGR